MFETSLHVLKTLQEAGFTAVFAGGCVRSSLIKKYHPRNLVDPSDYDIATSAKPHEVIKLFPNYVKENSLTHGVVKVIVDNIAIDVASLRRDSSYSDGRRPDSVEFTDSLEIDSKRRDFRINALYWDPISDQIFDYVDGEKDIESKRIQSVGIASDRFREDYLRMMRAIRFEAQTGFVLSAEVIKAIKLHQDSINNIAVERIRDELMKVLGSPFAVLGLRRMEETGLLAQILPEVDCLKNFMGDPIWHPEGLVFSHVMDVVECLKAFSPSAEVLLCGLMHDLGKSVSIQHYTDKEGRARVSNKGHDLSGAAIWLDIAHRLRFDNDTKILVYNVTALHMKTHMAKEFKKSTLVQFLRGPEVLNDRPELQAKVVDSLIMLQHCDSKSSGLPNKTNYEFLRNAQKLLIAEVSSKLLITGKDLIETLGCPPGKLIGIALNELRKAQDGGSIKTKEEALLYVKSIVQKGS